METSVEVRYAGVVVGRGVVREQDGAAGAFVAVPEPLPVGTFLTFKVGDAVREGQVEDIVESADPNAVGMRVRWGAPPAKAAPPKPAEPAVKAEAPRAPEAGAPEMGSAPDAADPGDESGEVAGGEAIPAPLGLAGPGGGGKRRRKRR